MTQELTHFFFFSLSITTTAATKALRTRKM